MAKLTYTAPVTETRNEARLLRYSISRYLDEATGDPVLDGDGAEQLIVEAVALVGDFNGVDYTVHEHVVLSPVIRKASVISTYFGTTNLAGFEAKILQFMQSEGLLPAGTIT